MQHYLDDERALYQRPASIVPAKPRRKRIHETDENKFWRKVRKTETCWLWIGDTDRSGYGRFQPIRRGLRILAHRWSYQHHFKLIPDGLKVLHRCDVPACVHPTHLFLGTQSDNIRDSVEKGRWPKIKLTNEQVFGIRELAVNGVSYREIGRRFSIHHSTVSNIVQRRAWQHL